MEFLVFASYSHKDSSLVSAILEGIRSAAKREDHPTVIWDDRCIDLGGEWKQAMDDGLARARVFLPFISHAYLRASDVVHHEMNEARLRHTAGELRVIPVCIESVELFRESLLGDFHGVTPEDISDEAGRAKACAAIAMTIEETRIQHLRDTANHLLISDVSELTCEFRDVILRDRKRFRIGPRPGYLRYERALTTGNKEHAQHAYIEDYREGLETFLDDGKEGNCVFTMYPEEKHGLWDPNYETDYLLPTLRRLRKRMICFESGSSLLNLETGRIAAEFKNENGRDPTAAELHDLVYTPNDTNCICVIQTEFGDAARLLIRYMCSFLPAETNVRFVFIPGPQSGVLEERWTQYRKFVWAIQAEHQGLKADEELLSITDSLIRDGIVKLSKRVLLDVALLEPLNTWEYKDARPVLERTLPNARFTYTNWRTCFVCGNDDIARAAHDAIGKHDRWAITERRISFVGFDGTSRMKELLQTVEGKTIEVNKERMCDAAEKMLPPAPIPLSCRVRGRICGAEGNTSAAAN